MNKPTIEDTREAARITSLLLKDLAELTKPGIVLEYLDEIIARTIVEHGATAYLKDYHPPWSKKPYPATICASVNEVVCHGIPDKYKLKEGDIVTYDICIKYKTACGDAAITVPVGEIDNRKARLLRYAKRALEAGIAEVKAGVKIAVISDAIEKEAVTNGYKIIREFSGHAIGAEMHEDPFIPNFYDISQVQRMKDKNVYEHVLKEGDVICIEPILTPGKGILGYMGDGWSAFNMDHQPAAMFEEMILVTKEGYEVLTTHI